MFTCTLFRFTSFQSKGKPPTPWGCLLWYFDCKKGSFGSRYAFILFETLNKRRMSPAQTIMNERQRIRQTPPTQARQPNKCKMLPISQGLKDDQVVLQTAQIRGLKKFKVIPHNCIVHPFCAYFMASFSVPSCTSTLKTWQICFDIELCQLKNGYSSSTSIGSPPFFQVIVINLS